MKIVRILIIVLMIYGKPENALAAVYYCGKVGGS